MWDWEDPGPGLKTSVRFRNRRNFNQLRNCPGSDALNVLLSHLRDLYLRYKIKRLF